MSEIIEDFSFEQKYKLGEHLYFLSSDYKFGELIITDVSVSFFVGGNNVRYKGAILPLSIYVPQRKYCEFSQGNIDPTEITPFVGHKYFSSLRLLNKYRNTLINQEIAELEAKRISEEECRYMRKDGKLTKLE